MLRNAYLFQLTLASAIFPSHWVVSETFPGFSKLQSIYKVTNKLLDKSCEVGNMCYNLTVNVHCMFCLKTDGHLCCFSKVLVVVGACGWVEGM